jgi:hypothetical protein
MTAAHFTRYVALAATLACTAPEDDPLACQQSYGFGNYGCADVTGTVLDSQDKARPNATVSAGGAGSDVFDFTQVTSDASGAFRMRLGRRWIAQDKGNDTTSTWVRAAFTTAAPVTTVRDSVLVQIRFFSFGQRPTPSTATLRLNIP